MVISPHPSLPQSFIQSHIPLHCISLAYFCCFIFHGSHFFFFENVGEGSDVLIFGGKNKMVRDEPKLKGL